MGRFSGLWSLHLLAQPGSVAQALCFGGVRVPSSLPQGWDSDPGTGVTEALGHSQGPNAGVWGARHARAVSAPSKLGRSPPSSRHPVPCPWSSLLTTFLLAGLFGLVAPGTLGTAVTRTWEAPGIGLARSDPAGEQPPAAVAWWWLVPRFGRLLALLCCVCVRLVGVRKPPRHFLPLLCPPSVPCSPGPVPLSHRPSGRACGAQWSPVFLPHCSCLCPHSRQRGGLLIPCSPRPEPLSNAWWELLHPLKAALCGSALCSPALACSAVPRIPPNRHSPPPPPRLPLLSVVTCPVLLQYLLPYLVGDGTGGGRVRRPEEGRELRGTSGSREQVCGLLGCSPSPAVPGTAK